MRKQILNFFTDSKLDYLIFLVLFFFVLMRGERSLWYYAGLLLSVTSFICWVMSRRELGNSFTVWPRARKLITTGMYSKIRHPIYFFSFLSLAGLIIAFQKPLLSILLLLLAVMQITRARFEEKILIAAFGQEFEKYKKGTRF